MFFPRIISLNNLSVSRIQGPGSRVQGSGIPARVSSQLPGVEGLEIGWMDGWMGGCEWMDGWM